ncbi:hypothetical protein CEXT_464251 [Caerostris extrusa]|uniref:Uncharacterized protein n=1 Tax=Caerostris extrusa TaxID=172846 RepID=A0AAV4TWY5_CAEEX|nr:hypothetical protein CEXT_464251 [Caerostris extrusa]
MSVGPLNINSPTSFSIPPYSTSLPSSLLYLFGVKRRVQSILISPLRFPSRNEFVCFQMSDKCNNMARGWGCGWEGEEEDLLRGICSRLVEWSVVRMEPSVIE